MDRIDIDEETREYIKISNDYHAVSNIINVHVRAIKEEKNKRGTKDIDRIKKCQEIIKLFYPIYRNLHGKIQEFY